MHYSSTKKSRKEQRSEDPLSSKDNENSRPNPEELWSLHVDGSSDLSGSEVGLILSRPKGEVVAYALCFKFFTTNNETKYEALIAGLKIAKEVGA